MPPQVAVDALASELRLQCFVVELPERAVLSAAASDLRKSFGPRGLNGTSRHRRLQRRMKRAIVPCEGRATLTSTEVTGLEQALHRRVHLPSRIDLELCGDLPRGDEGVRGVAGCLGRRAFTSRAARRSRLLHRRLQRDESSDVRSVRRPDQLVGDVRWCQRLDWLEDRLHVGRGDVGVAGDQ